MASGDNEKRVQCMPNKPWLILERLVDLIEHPISESATKRQIELINKFLYITKCAFWVHDLPKIIRLYEAVSKKIEILPQFSEPFKSLLELSAIPPILEKFSDKNEYMRDFSQYFSTLGYLIICIHDNNLVNLVFEAISSLLTKKTQTGTCYSSLEQRQEAAEKSRLAEIVSELLEIIDEKLYDKLLELMILISEISTKTSRIFAETDAITYLLTRLDPYWKKRSESRQVISKDPLPTVHITPLENTSRILWRLLNSLDEEHADIPAPNLFSLRSLQYAFRWTLINKQQKANRNNLAGIILKLLDFFPNLEIKESGLAEDLVILSVQTGGRDQDKVFQFPEDEDFQFQKTVLSCLTYFFKHNATTVLQERHVMIGLLLMLSKENVTAKRRDEHHCQLLISALRLIPKIVPYSLEDFLQTGPSILIKMIEQYIAEPYNVRILESCVYCISKILEMDYEELISAFDDKNLATLNTVISITDKLVKTKTLRKHMQRCIAYNFCILQNLTKKAHHEVNIEAVNLCANYLTRVVHSAQEEFEIDPKVTICALHFLWYGVIITSRHLFYQFILKGGIYMLLDIINISTFPVKLIAVGALADICQKSVCVPYLITWRKRRKTVLPLLMEVFRGETKGYCNLGKPEILPTNTNKALTLCSGKTINLDIDKQTLLECCRPKVQAILLALKTNFKEKVDIANEQYCLYEENLNTDDKLSMLFAENYSGLKMCEAWINVAKALIEENIKPIDEDLDNLKDKIDRIRKWRLHIRRTVEQIINEEKQMQRLSEFHLYNNIKESKLSDALDALQELKYISNCTERMFQMRKKMRLSHEVDAIRFSVANIDVEYNYHKTMTDLPFTNIYDQKVSIESNVIVNKDDHRKSNISLVSLDDDKLDVGIVFEDESLVTRDPMSC